MKSIKLADVHIPPNRQRQEFDEAALVELKESITTRGLYHPIVLREEEEQISSNPDISVRKFFLVAGERRLRAVSDIHALGDSFKYDQELVPVGEIPYVNLGELDQIQREEAELEENIRRADLTWQERATATARLEALRNAQAASRGEAPPTVAAIALEVRGSAEGVNQAETRREIIVARYLDDPEVKAAKTVGDAFKVVKRKEETAKRVQLAATVGATYGTSALQAHNTAAERHVPTLAAEQFDVICTDPIYGIGADEFGDSGGKAAGAHFYEDTYEKWKADITFLAQEGFRITKPQAHLYCFCDITRFEELKAILAAAGWKPFRTPIIWHKPNGSRTPWVNAGPQRKYELICYAMKGDKLVTKIYPDLVSYPADENLGHHAQKPVALYEDLLRRSVQPGDSVIDFFAGSGPILPAGFNLKCKVTALEIDPAAYALCTGRIDKLKDQPELEGLV